MRWTRGPQVAAAVVVGKEGETRKSGEIRKLREEETAVGMIFFPKICRGVCMAKLSYSSSYL